jgi:hypothetical protein
LKVRQIVPAREVDLIWKLPWVIAGVSNEPLDKVPTVPQASVRTTAFPNDDNQNENPDNKITIAADIIFVFTLSKKLCDICFIEFMRCVYLRD